ncbi:MAG: DUF4199 domain-containing protein [Vicinamibacterales bacterium]
MHPILSTGLMIGVLCGIWTFVMGFTGWYKDPVMLWAFFFVVVIEVAGLVWGLRKTAAEGRIYGGQVVAGTLMAVIAGVVIIGSSLLFTMVAFPDYFAELEAAQRKMLQAQGQTADQIDAAIEAGKTAATPMANAMSGFIGTLVTGILASAVIALFVRARPAAARAPL